MEIDKLKKNYKIAQIIGGVIPAVGLTAWKVADSFDPRSGYYGFVTSGNFNLLYWIVVAAIMCKLNAADKLKLSQLWPIQKQNSPIRVQAEKCVLNIMRDG